MNVGRKVGFVILCVFAAIGLVLVGGYFAVRFHVTNTSGAIDLNDRYFADLSGRQSTSTLVLPEVGLWCKLIALYDTSPHDAQNIIVEYRKSGNAALAENMLSAVTERSSGDAVLQGEFTSCDERAENVETEAPASTTSLYPWINTEDWSVLAAAIGKDAPVLNQAAQAAGVDPRLVAAQIVGEQMRLYNSDRELYKAVLAPLKIMVSETQFSLGVTGVKVDTAEEIEKNLTDPSSEYYPGDQYAHLLDFKTADPATERYARLTDEHDHYYSYLYTALFIKEVEAQWAREGYDISGRPEIISTLYNIGFAGSHPNADPHVGGSVITINGADYTFGSLGYEFYYSGELQADFPYTN